jgi:hypothetical protein
MKEALKGCRFRDTEDTPMPKLVEPKKRGRVKLVKLEKKKKKRIKVYLGGLV